MKRLIRFIIFGAILYPMLSVVVSCSEEADCSMATRAMMQCYLYTIDKETDVVSKDTLDSLTITAYGTDSIIVITVKIYSRFNRTYIPLQQNIDGYGHHLPDQHALFPVNGLRISDETVYQQSKM